MTRKKTKHGTATWQDRGSKPAHEAEPSTAAPTSSSGEGESPGRTDREVFPIVGIAILFLDRANRILRFTPQIEELFDIQVTDRGRALSDFTTRLGYDRLAADAREVLEQLVPIEREAQDEAGRWYSIRIRPYRDPDDRIAGVVVTFVDISERYESERSLRESEERFRALVTASSEVVYRMSPDWGEMRQLHGWGVLADTGDASRTWFEEYIPPEERPRVRAAIDEAIRTERAFELEHRVRRTDGRVGWTFSRAVPIVNEAGAVVEWFGAASDVSERRAAEERLRDADRRKDEYLAMLGHELRNPLAAIRNATELLLRAGPEDERSRRAYGVLQRQTVHMSTIIDGLLDVSRIARGKLAVALEPLDICELVKHVIQVQSSQTASRGLDLEADVAPEPLWVAGDEARLAQVFDNLIGNAIKFTPAPGVVTVACRREDDAAVIRVRDTGVGIRPEVLATIFEPFQQVQDAVGVTGGLGLGLSLAKGLVELHRGTIEAHSAGAGRGAEFVVRLALISAPNACARSEPDEEAVSRRVLVVEDNVDGALMLRDLLELYGHEVTLADSGCAALDVLHARPVDVVLCDVGLPGMSGYELARRIRKDPALRRIALIAVTGHGLAEDRERAAEAGFDEHLTKPTDLRLLSGLLERLGESRLSKWSK